jgi:hypothetical protein
VDAPEGVARRERAALVKPGEKVHWYGSTGTVVGVIDEPCLVIEWANGEQTIMPVSRYEAPRIEG